MVGVPSPGGASRAAATGRNAVALSDSVPPGGWQGALRYSDLAVEGRPHSAPGVGGWIATRRVTPEYFRALDIPVIRGRGFTGQDSNKEMRLVVLSRLAAARLFPGEDPIGKMVGPGSDTSFTVAGVAEDAKNTGLMGEERPEIYYLRRDVASDWSDRRAVLVIGSALPEATVAGWVQAAVHNLDPTVPVEIVPLAQAVDKLADQPRLRRRCWDFLR